MLVDWYSKSSCEHGENNGKLKQTLTLLVAVYNITIKLYVRDVR
jgi:hypothetical protein